MEQLAGAIELPPAAAKHWVVSPETEKWWESNKQLFEKRLHHASSCCLNNKRLLGTGND
jgi:hypothetical protein